MLHYVSKVTILKVLKFYYFVCQTFIVKENNVIAQLMYLLQSKCLNIGYLTNFVGIIRDHERHLSKKSHDFVSILETFD